MNATTVKDVKPAALSEVERESALEKLQGKNKRVRERQRKLEIIQEQDIYMIDISLRSGMPETMVVKFDNIPIQLERFKRELQRGDSKVVRKISSAARTAYKTLESAKKKIQRKMIYWDPTWFVPAETLVEVADAVEEARSQIEPLKEAIALSHEKDRRIMCFGLIRLLASSWPKPTLPPDADDDAVEAIYAELEKRRGVILQIAAEKMAKIPTTEEVVERLGMDLIVFGSVPSVEKQAEINASLAQAIAAEQAALAQQAEIERAELIATQAQRVKLQAEKDQIEAQRRAFQAISDKAVGEIYKAFADGLKMLQTQISGNNVNRKTRAAVKNSMENMERLMAMARDAIDLDEFVEKHEELKGIMVRADKGEQDYMAELDNLKKWLIPQAEKRHDVDVDALIIQGMVR